MHIINSIKRLVGQGDKKERVSKKDTAELQLLAEELSFVLHVGYLVSAAHKVKRRSRLIVGSLQYSVTAEDLDELIAHAKATNKSAGRLSDAHRLNTATKTTRKT